MNEKNKAKYSCEIKGISEIAFNVACIDIRQNQENRKPIELKCVIVPKGQSSSITIAGSGVGHGFQEADIKCFSLDDLKEKVAKKLKVKKEEIIWIED